jgi:predicted acylesterase/phospholipase RssA
MVIGEGSYGVVFSGGGALGAWEVGCYQAIQSRHGGKAPEVVTGASGGALNAAGVCAGLSAAELQRQWKALSVEKVYARRYGFFSYIKFGADVLLSASAKKTLQRFTESTKSFFDTKPLELTLKAIFRDSMQSFFQSPIRFAISVTDLATGSARYFYKVPVGQRLSSVNNDTWRKVEGLEMLIQGLMATTALPILFPPFEGFFDGGVLLNQPISPAIELGARNLYVLIPTAQSLGLTTNLLTIMETVLSTWLSASLIAQIRTVRLRNQIRGYTDESKIRVCVIRPESSLEKDLGVSILSFGEKVDEMVGLGEQAANQRLNRFDPDNEDTWY